MAVVFGIIEILLKIDFYNDFCKHKISNLQELDGTSCYLSTVKFIIGVESYTN